MDDGVRGMAAGGCDEGIIGVDGPGMFILKGEMKFSILVYEDVGSGQTDIGRSSKTPTGFWGSTQRGMGRRTEQTEPKEHQASVSPKETC